MGSLWREQLKPLRICLVSKEYPPEGIGGVPAYVYRLAHGLAADGHDVTLIAGAPANGSNSSLIHASSPSPRLYRVQDRKFPLPPPVRARGSGIWELLEHSWIVDRTIARLEGTQGPFDVVEMPNGGAEALFFSLHPHAPLVVRVSTPLKLTHQFKNIPPSRIGFPLHAFLESLPVRRADRIISHSRFNADYSAEVYGVPASEVHVIYLGVEVPKKSPPKSKEDGQTIRVLYVGRLQRRKGIHLLLQAIPLVARKLKHVQFNIAGLDTGDAHQMAAAVSDEIEQGTYEKAFNKIASPDALMATSFLGHVDQTTLYQLYAESDILVAPSLFESFGLMYAEAMAHSKPVVALRTGAAPEVVVHNQTGILVEPNDVTALANALINLATNREMRQELGRRGHKRAYTEFSVQRMVNETVDLYRQVTAAKSEQ